MLLGFDEFSSLRARNAQIHLVENLMVFQDTHKGNEWWEEEVLLQSGPRILGLS